MPNHCYSADYRLQQQPEYQIVDFTVAWNYDVYHETNYASGEVDTQEEVDDLFCEHTTTKDSNSIASITWN